MIWLVVGLVPVLAAFSWALVAYVRRPRDPGPVVLESGEPRERVASVVDRSRR